MQGHRPLGHHQGLWNRIWQHRHKVQQAAWVKSHLPWPEPWASSASTGASTGGPTGTAGLAFEPGPWALHDFHHLHIRERQQHLVQVYEAVRHKTLAPACPAGLRGRIRATGPKRLPLAGKTETCWHSQQEVAHRASRHACTRCRRTLAARRQGRRQQWRRPPARPPHIRSSDFHLSLGQRLTSEVSTVGATPHEQKNMENKKNAWEEAFHKDSGRGRGSGPPGRRRKGPRATIVGSGPGVDGQSAVLGAAGKRPPAYLVDDVATRPRTRDHWFMRS